jgi:prepilin-type N-terminal cleavage/methylation domain-containing protein
MLSVITYFATEALRSARRLRDGARRTRDGRVRGRHTRGLSVIELLVTLSLVAIIVGIASPRASTNGFAMWQGQAQLMGDLRQTRGDALAGGDHFILEVHDTTTYSESRMSWNGVAWVKNVIPERTRTLPDGVVFSAGVGAAFEFNTRGLLVLPDAAQSLRIRHTATGHERQITVWPSGQVAPL